MSDKTGAYFYIDRASQVLSHLKCESVECKAAIGMLYDAMRELAQQPRPESEYDIVVKWWNKYLHENSLEHHSLDFIPWLVKKLNNTPESGKGEK